MIVKRNINYITAHLLSISYGGTTELLTNRPEKFYETCNPCYHTTAISFCNDGQTLPHLSLPRNHQVILTRIYLRITKASHSHIISNHPPKVCPNCNNIELSLEHIFMDCPSFNIPRQTIINFCNSQNINFSLCSILNAKIPPHIIIDFLKSTSTINLI